MSALIHIHKQWAILALITVTGLLLLARAEGETRTVDLELVGSSSNGRPIASTATTPTSHFMSQARDVYGHAGNVSGFQLRGSFGQVYPGISLACYGDEHHFEYAFQLSAGADPSQIRLRLSNVQTEGVTAQGDIVYVGDGFETYQHAPVVSRINEAGSRRASGRLSANGNGESSVALSTYSDEHREELNQTRLSIVPGDGVGDGPQYTFFMSKFETTNQQLIRFLNDTQANRGNPRGENMFFDAGGNIWMNPAMQVGRDEMFRIDAAKIQYNPNRVSGDRFHHVITDNGREPYADHPATGLSWYGAVKYCNWLTLQSGRGPNELCYTEGTNTMDWAPATATNWANGFFTTQERDAWLAYKGFRLPMFHLYDPHNSDTNMFNEFLKAGSWMGDTNVLYGFGRNTFTNSDANARGTAASMATEMGTLPVGYFNGLNPLRNGRTHLNENHFGIHDLNGNVAEWANDPARAGTPNARSACGGSFEDTIQSLNVDRMIPPYTCDNVGGFRAVTTYMPEEYTQVNILFCFHTPNGIASNDVSRFGAQFWNPPRSGREDPELGSADVSGDDSASPSRRVDDDGDDTPPPSPPGIIYDDDVGGGGDGSDDDSDDGTGGGGGGGGGGGPGQPPPPPPPPPPTYRLGLSSENPNSGVTIGISNADINNQASGPAAFERYYYYGEVVTVTAPATVGDNVFQYWERNGVPFSTSLSITVEMLTDLNLTAVYLTPVPPVQRILDVTSPAGSVPVTVSLEDNNGGGNGSTTFSRIYDDGSTVTLEAPTSFNGDPSRSWLRNGIPFSSDPSVTVTMFSDVTLTATYGDDPVPNERILTVASSNPNGNVPIAVSTPDNDGAQNGNTTFQRLYDQGSVVTLIAPTTAGGNTFAHWLRDGVRFSSSPSVDVSLQTDISMTAVYVDPPPEIVLTVNSTPVSAVAIAIGTPDNGGNAGGLTSFVRYYNSGDTTTATAPSTVAGGTLTFNRWVMNGIPLSTNTSVSISLLVDTELTAVYLDAPDPTPTYTLIVQSQDPDSGVNISVSTPDELGNADGSTSFTRTYEEGAETVLTAPATAPNGYVFDRWLMDGQPYSTDSTINVAMYDNHTVTAVYEEVVPPLRHVLTVESRNPNSSVVVTVSPGDVNGQQNGTTTFTRLYEDGEVVSLTARNPAFPGSSNMLQFWLLNGNPFSTNATITVTMLQDTTVTAVYGTAPPPNDHTLTVQSQDAGGGVAIQISEPDLSSATDGVTDFNRLYPYGTPVTATAPATAPNGNVFQHWLLNGSVYTSDASIDVSMLGDHTIVAVYGTPPIEHVLTVESRNPGNGVDITVSTADNNSDQDGTTQFQRFYGDGVGVTLTAPGTAPNGRDIFQGWERDGTIVTTNAAVTVTMYSDIDMTAVYVPPNTFDLTVRSQNPEDGVNVSVSTPDNAGDTDGVTEFVRTYDPGTLTTLTAANVSGDGTVFQEWLRNGLSYSTDRSIDITMLSDIEMTAVYGPTPPEDRWLVVRTENPSSGVTIGATPDQRGNGGGEAAFVRLYQDGDIVTVSAPATAGGNVFQQWTLDGRPFSTNLTATIPMLADHEVIAIYGDPITPENRTLVVDSRNPNSGVTIEVSRLDINGSSDGDTTFTRTYTFGDTTTLTAPVQGGTNATTFLYWELNGSRYSDSRTVSVEMFTDMYMTAVYGDADIDVTLTVNAADADTGNAIGGVIVSVAPADNIGNTTGATGFQRTYDQGVTATLTAPSTANGDEFQYWERDGTAISTNQTVNVELLTDVTMTAIYGAPIIEDELRLIVSAEGPDGHLSTTVTATPDNYANAVGNTTFTRFYDTGTSVTLSAPASDTGVVFDHWELNGTLYSLNQTISFPLLADQTMTAVYVLDPVHGGTL